MTIEDAPRFAERLTAVGEVFDAKLSEAKITLYFEALKDLHLGDVLEALGETLKTCKFMPKPVEIRDLAIGTVEDLAEQAWVEAREAMRRLGAYHTPIFDAVIAHSLTDTFGTWPAACSADLSPEMWASKRKEFLRAFHRHQRNETTPMVKRLSGVFDLERGLPPVRAISDAEIQKALGRG